MHNFDDGVIYFPMKRV